MTIGTPAEQPIVAPHEPAEEEYPVIAEARGLTLGFGSKTVLEDVNLAFPQGSITALLGPTGSGKTTFLRCLNRMNDRVTGFRHSGDVLLDGQSIFGSGNDVMALRRRVGMVFQRPNPFPMSIIDNVACGLRAHGIASKKQAREIAGKRLVEVGLWPAVSDRLDDSPFRLSGGQQQLLCLARTLAVGPGILLLDEPTSSLDPVSTQSIEELIVSLAPGLTVIVVTHNLAQARRISDRTAFFFDGRLVEAGPTRQVLENPREEATASYVTGRIG